MSKTFGGQTCLAGRYRIDPDGNVQGFEVLTPPVGRNVSETIRQIRGWD